MTEWTDPLRSRLNDLWCVEKRSTGDIAKRLRMDKRKVIAEAERLGFPPRRKIRPKTTEAELATMRELKAAGRSIKEIAAIVGCSDTLVCDVLKHGRTYNKQRPATPSVPAPPLPEPEPYRTPTLAELLAWSPRLREIQQELNNG